VGAGCDVKDRQWKSDPKIKIFGEIREEKIGELAIVNF